MSPIVNETSLEAICDPFIAGWRGWMALALFSTDASHSTSG